MRKIVVLLSITIFFTYLSITAYVYDYTKERLRMVEEQIEARGITSTSVLNSMKMVPRHLFVTQRYIELAYTDNPLPIGYGQTISQPYIVAEMTELLNVDSCSKVLEIGTGSGYQAAVLSYIVDKVYTIEIIEPLAKRAKKTFDKLDYDNIHVKIGDGYYGWQKHAPYDAIVVTCAAEYIPPLLLDQLREGGLMCIPVGPPFSTQDLLLIEKQSDEKIITKVIAQVMFVPLTREKK